MTAYLPIALRNQIDELFADILRLDVITGKTRLLLELGKTLLISLDPVVLMESMLVMILQVDVDSIMQNSDNLFNYIFDCLSKKQIAHEFAKDYVRNIYQQLRPQDKEIINDYARQIKRICEIYATEKKATLEK